MHKYLFFLLLFPGFASGQIPDTLTLFECYEMAIGSDPAMQEKMLLNNQHQLKIKNAGMGWYPSLDLNGSYTWQSEVVELGEAISVPGFEVPVMPHYNYKLTLDIRQTIYDGGLAKSQKAMETSNHSLSQQQIDIEIYTLKERVNMMYFYLLILQKQKEMATLMLDELKQKGIVVESGIRNGILLSSDLDLIMAEILKVEQQLSEIRISEKSTGEILGLLIGNEFSEVTKLVIPDIDVDITKKSERPEYQLFELQINNLDASKEMVRTQRIPRLYAFGTLGYGNPALNFFRDEFRGYYIVGAGLQWKLWDWGKTSRERQVLTIQQDIVESKKESFEKNLEIMLKDELARIIKYEESVKTDKEIVILREKITKTAASQLENGVITSADYITELNAETQAKIKLETHKIQLVQARINYLTKKGNI